MTHRVVVKLHPLAIIRNSIMSFKSRITLVPAPANTIGGVDSPAGPLEPEVN